MGPSQGADGLPLRSREVGKVKSKIGGWLFQPPLFLSGDCRVYYAQTMPRREGHFMKEFFVDGWGALVLLLLIAPPILALRISTFMKFMRWFIRQWRSSR